jgi:hypothetical protein
VVPDLPQNPGVFVTQHSQPEILAGKYGYVSEAEQKVQSLVAEEVSDVRVQEAVETPTDDRSQVEQVQIEKKDIAEDPDLYAVRNFSL